MVELRGDVCAPSELVVPNPVVKTMSGLGIMFISGTKIWFHDGTSPKLITST